MTNFSELWDKDFRFNKEAVFACYFNKNMPSIWNYGDNWGNGSQMGPPNFAPGEEGGWDEAFGEINFYNKFPAGARKDATYQTVYYLGNDPGKAVDYTKLTHKHPYFLKYRDDESYDPATHKMNDWWGSATIYVIRYAEVLLTYAEAKAMSGAGPDKTAYDAVNEVRLRAGLKDLQPGLGQLAFRDSVIAERGWEFAGFEPAARWYDLIRTETVAKANAGRNAGKCRCRDRRTTIRILFTGLRFPSHGSGLVTMKTKRTGILTGPFFMYVCYYQTSVAKVDR